MNRLTKEKGFTIIEVVLVLAIAGLIFLMVFIALPALQRNQRDTQRKNDMSRVQTAVVNFANSNRGAIPTNFTTFTTQYLTANGADSFVDPAGALTGQTSQTTYNFVPLAATGTLPTSFATAQNIIYYTTGVVCGATSDTVKTGAGTRKIAFRMVLEGGGYHCVNN